MPSPELADTVPWPPNGRAAFGGSVAAPEAPMYDPHPDEHVSSPSRRTQRQGKLPAPGPSSFINLFPDNQMTPPVPRERDNEAAADESAMVRTELMHAWEAHLETTPLRPEAALSPSRGADHTISNEGANHARQPRPHGVEQAFALNGSETDRNSLFSQNISVSTEGSPSEQERLHGAANDQPMTERAHDDPALAAQSGVNVPVCARCHSVARFSWFLRLQAGDHRPARICLPCRLYERDTKNAELPHDEEAWAMGAVVRAASLLAKYHSEALGSDSRLAAEDQDEVRDILVSRVREQKRRAAEKEEAETTARESGRHQSKRPRDTINSGSSVQHTATSPANDPSSSSLPLSAEANQTALSTGSSLPARARKKRRSQAPAGAQADPASADPLRPKPNHASQENASETHASNPTASVASSRERLLQTLQALTAAVQSLENMAADVEQTRLWSDVSKRVATCAYLIHARLDSDVRRPDEVNPETEINGIRDVLALLIKTSKGVEETQRERACESLLEDLNLHSSVFVKRVEANCQWLKQLSVFRALDDF